MSTDPSRPRTRLTGALVLLGIVCVLYLVMMGNISEPASDPNTRRLDVPFAVFFTLMLWIVLAILLLAGGVAGEMRIVATILLLLSGVAAIYAGVLSLRYHGWAIVVPASLPPLISLYAIWARLQALHAALPARVINVAIGGAILIMTIAPLPLSVIDAATFPERQRRQEAAAAAKVAALVREAGREREREIARYEALNADSPLVDFLDAPDIAHYQQALAKARQVKSRQSDVVALLEGGKIERLEDLWRLDVEPTPAVCTAYGTALQREAANIGPFSDRDWYLYAADVTNAVLRQLPNLKWLAGNGCDLNAVSIFVDARLRDYCGECPASNSDDKKILVFLNNLAALRRQR
jgi:hypothetical protein